MNCLATLAVTTMWLKSQINVEARAKAKQEIAGRPQKKGPLKRLNTMEYRSDNTLALAHLTQVCFRYS